MNLLIEGGRSISRNVREIGNELRYFWAGDNPYPRLALPIPEGLSFEDRWQAAQQLSPYEQHEFIRQEILTLMGNVVERGGLNALRRVVVDPSTILNSALAPGIGNYLVTPVLNPEISETWKNPEIKLRLKAKFWTHQLGAEAGISLKVEEAIPPTNSAIKRGGFLVYSMVDLEGMGVSFDVSVFSRSKVEQTPPLWEPKVTISKGSGTSGMGWESWEKPTAAKLQSRYEAAKAYLEGVSTLAVARGFVGLASDALAIRGYISKTTVSDRFSSEIL